MEQMNRNTPVELTNMCMIYDDQGNVLVEEKVGKDYKGIVFPGGHIENGEPIVDSVIREIYEETGLTVSNLELCGVKDWVKEDGNRYIVFLYRTNNIFRDNSIIIRRQYLLDVIRRTSSKRTILAHGQND